MQGMRHQPQLPVGVSWRILPDKFPFPVSTMFMGMMTRKDKILSGFLRKYC